jgi:hypothetical protein
MLCAFSRVAFILFAVGFSQPALAQYAEAIMAAAKAVSENQKQRKFEAWQGKVSKNLRTIVDQNAAILKELQSLRIHIDEAFRTNTRNAYKDDLDAQLERFDIYLKDIPKNRLRAFPELGGELEQSTIKVRDKGMPGLFPTVYAGAMAILGVYDVIRVRRPQRRRLIENFVATFDAWIQDRPGTFIYESKKFRAEWKSKRDALIKLQGTYQINTHTASIFSPRVGRPSEFAGNDLATCSAPVTATITVTAALDVSVSNVGVGSRCRVDFDPARYQSAHLQYLQKLADECREMEAKAMNLEAQHQLLINLRKQLNAARFS